MCSIFMVYCRMIERSTLRERIADALRRSRVVILTGPRQSGKTTLARLFLPVDHVNYFDLEDPQSLARLDEPMTALRSLQGLVVIDEVQRRPDLFPVIRVLSDREDKPATFLLLGSASGDLLRQSSESLAGRAESIEIGGFRPDEVGSDRIDDLWNRGGLPPSFLAASDQDSVVWRSQFIQTLLERDLPQWGTRVSPTALRRFWMIVAHYHGQVWNASEAARSLGTSEPTARRYLDLLTDAMMIRQLQPYHANIAKRQVRSPKVYVRDSGLLHQLLHLGSLKDLLHHPRVGASWEGFVIEQLLLQLRPTAAYFWATHQGAEIDLVIRDQHGWRGVEVKRRDAPTATRSMRTALVDLGLDRIDVIYPGTQHYQIEDRIYAVPLTMLASPLPTIG